MAGSADFRKKIINDSGRILTYPNVGVLEDLKTSRVLPSPYEAPTADQRAPLGAILEEGDREWVYCKAGGTALVAGNALQAAAIAHAEQDDDIVVAAAAAAGDYTVTLTSTANLDTAPNDSADTFKDGYLIVNDEAGEGHSYKIKSNEAMAATANFVVTLYDPLIVALTTASQVGLARSPFNQVIATAAPLTGTYVGFAPRAVTAAYFFWAQRKGPCAVVAKTAIARGVMLCVGETAAVVDDYTPVTTVATVVSIIGRCITPGIADGESFLAYLTY